jgi:hypothetical protein
VSRRSRSAALAAALLLVTPGLATAESPQHALPAGSVVVFVSDGHLDIASKPGSSVKIHLRDDLHLDGYLIAPAGTQARLVLGGPTIVNGRREATIALEEFVTHPGRIPVRPRTVTLEALDVGTTIEAITLAEVDDVDGRLSIRVPFPFRLSTDAPFSMYTPTPAKTAAPPRTPTPRSRPSPPAPSPAASPAAVAPQPLPTGTKIPS